LTGISFDCSAAIKLVVIVVSTATGLFFLGWATWTQIRVGGGTPTPNSPTRRLVTVGPYRYTRNPIEFGAIWYYLGFGCILGTIFHGIVCMLSGLIFGSICHKFVEEKALLLRFGNEYAEYKKRTPFLFPRLRPRN